jgi:RNA polymerase sigma factor (sigma-70 family)
VTDSSLAVLKRLLVLHYDDLKRRLAQRLGSTDLAGDALHDTWLRLERGDGIAAVRSHEAYLYRIAINSAMDRRRTENRRLTDTEVDGLLEIADDMPDPEQIAVGRSDLRALQAIIFELPPRHQKIFMAAHVEGLSRSEIAKRCRISIRQVHRELREAQDYCSARFRQLQQVTLGPPETSPKESVPTAAGKITPPGDRT